MRWYYWLLIGVLLAAVVFGIVQPFVWMLKFGQPPPAGAVSLSLLLTIVLALIALGVTAFSVLAYRDLEHRLKRSLEESLGEEIRNESRSALTRAVGNIAFAYWRSWRLNRQDFELLRGAIMIQSWSLDSVEGLKPTEMLPERRCLQMKSNIAGYTFYLGKHFRNKVQPEDVERARRVGKEAYEKAKDFGDNYDWKANYAGLLSIFGTSEEKKLATKIKEELQQRHKLHEIPDDEWQEYCELLGELP